jgi:hypothetical protein
MAYQYLVPFPKSGSTNADILHHISHDGSAGRDAQDFGHQRVEDRTVLRQMVMIDLVTLHRW